MDEHVLPTASVHAGGTLAGTGVAAELVVQGLEQEVVLVLELAVPVVPGKPPRRRRPKFAPVAACSVFPCAASGLGARGLLQGRGTPLFWHRHVCHFVCFQNLWLADWFRFERGPGHF